tara:strand:+ start:2113 stop:2550 length:438 start_codon:yes stop_codon:yes gene_type:complete
MIREAKQDDIIKILEIEMASFNRPWTKKNFVNELNNIEVSLNYVHIYNNQVKGYIFGWHIKNEYHLNNIAVHENYRCKGIAKGLIFHLINELIQLQVTMILLEVNEYNTSAKNLYESLGFNSVGIRKKYYNNKQDAILYNLKIPS